MTRDEGVAPDGAPPESAPAEAHERVEKLRAAINVSVQGQVLGFTAKQRADWARELDLLHRRGLPGGHLGDGYTWEQIDEVIAWLPTHRGSGDFAWGRVVLSPAKLRKHFPKLLADMRSPPARRPKGNVDLDAWDRHEEKQRARAQ